MAAYPRNAPGSRFNNKPGHLQPAYDVLRRFVDQEHIPGVVTVIGTSNGALPPFAYGEAAWEPTRTPVRADTLYDCASLTKVVVTTTMTLLLVDEGRLHLDEPVGRHVPEFVEAASVDPRFPGASRLRRLHKDRRSATSKRGVEPTPQEVRASITIRQLLTHTSGLSAWSPLYKSPEHGRKAIVETLCRTPLESLPGSTVSYSCLGFILLGVILERVGGARLDSLAQERIFSPLNMADSGYLPSVERLARIAPTEKEGGRIIHGIVHDENARAMGGVSGNAGIFSTAPDLAKFAQMILRRGSGHPRLLSTSAIASATRNQTSHISDEPRGLGWLLGAASGSPGGDLFGPRSFGHTGFTGTSLWLDPDHNLFVVLLTNRVHPTRENEAHLDLRPLFHNTVAAALL